jgi:ribosomal protein S18 acetylase RimI-like enzyme
LVREEDTPLMALVEGAALNSADVPAGVSIRELPADEAALHARVAALGFEAPEWMFAQFLTPSVLALPGVRCYVAEQGDEAVATGLGVTAGDSVAIFNIATPTEHRRNGYGAAVTARAVSDGLMAGADWAWLQSSPAGLGVYQRLGFEVVETWQCWASQV